MFKILRRYYANGRKRTVKTNVTFAQAQAHCQSSESASYTCNSAAAKRITKTHGVWSDYYERM